MTKKGERGGEIQKERQKIGSHGLHENKGGIDEEEGERGKETQIEGNGMKGKKNDRKTEREFGRRRCDINKNM